MRGSAGILDSVAALLAAAGIDVPPWGFLAFAAAITLVLMPRILANMETGRARRLVKRSRGAEGEDRRQLEQQALEVARDRPATLVAVAEEAIRARRSPLAHEAVRRLASTGQQRQDLRRLRRELAVEPDLPRSAVAAALVIERLLEAGADAEAQRRLRRFLRRWPDDDELQSIAARLLMAPERDAGG